jgi:hypothetical protein
MPIAARSLPFTEIVAGFGNRRPNRAETIPPAHRDETTNAANHARA